MDIPKKSQRFFLLFLFFLILFFQYPRTEHMIGNDSFQNMGMSRMLLDSGTMSWALHPSSVFGLYPFSYPSGVQTLTAAMAVSTPLSLELCYLLVSAAMVLLGASGMFMMAGEINRNFIFKFSAAFSFVLTPVVFKYSTWTASTRGAFILMLPFFLYLCLKAMHSVRKTRFFFTALIFFIVLVSIHHMGLLLPFLIGAIFTGYAVFLTLQKVKLVSFYWAEASRTISLVVLIFIGFIFYLQFLKISKYQPDNYIFSAWFLYGDEPHIMIMNGLIFYTMSIGTLFIFLGLGLARVVEKIEKNPGEWSLLFFLIFYGNFLLDIKYMVAFMVPLLVPFIGMGIYETVKRIEHQKVKALLILLLVMVFSLLHSGYAYMKLHDMNFQRNYGSTGTVTVREKSYNSIVYADYLNMNTITNENLLQRRILGYTGLHVMPFEDFEIPDVDEEYVENLSIKKYDLNEMYEGSHDQLWYVEKNGGAGGMDPKRAYSTIASRMVYLNSTKENLSRYDIKYAISHDLLEVEGKQGYTGLEMRPPYEFSWFFYSLPENRYAIYRNDFQSFYWL